MATSFEVIFLGNRPLIDTTQGNPVAENAAALLGTYGSAGSPLFNTIRTLTANSLGVGDPNGYDTANSGGFDSFRINGGAPQNFDAVATFEAIITYINGITATVTATVFQDTAGNTYLAPAEVNNADQIALNAAPIRSLELVNVTSAVGDMAADRFAGDFKAPVDGTAGNDDIGLGFTDAQGDQVTTGNDYILAGDGNDTIRADAGNDSIFSGVGDDLVLAGDGDDFVQDSIGNDFVFGGAGSDTINLNQGNDTVFGETGDDAVFVWDFAGIKTADGGSGIDTLGFGNASTATGVAIDINAAGAGSFTHSSSGTSGSFTNFESFTGSLFNDTLDARDAAIGVGLSGEAGNDRIMGGSGSDTIAGGAGADTIAGWGGDDSILGGDGDDIISGDLQAIALINGDFSAGSAGWSGNDIEVNSEGAYLGNGSTNTVVEMDGNAGITTVLQQSFSVFAAGVARLTFDGVVRSSGNVGLDGFRVEILNGAGTVIALANIFPPSNTTWTRYTLDATLPASGTYTLRFTELGDNNSEGALLDNVQFVAISGNDTINAGEGSDAVDAGGGDDLVIVDGAFSGIDTLDGGAGNDTLVLTPADNRNLTVNMLAGTVADSVAGDQRFANFENVTTGGGDDSVQGTAAANLIFTLGGNDTISAGAGDDTVEGGDGADQISGDDGNDRLSGGAGNDSLTGGAGDDTLFGGDGNDTLIAGTNTGLGDRVFGEAGDDRLIDSSGLATLDGGSGTDVFELGTGAATVIGGEDAGNTDIDRLDFLPVDAAVNVQYDGNESGSYTNATGNGGQFSQIEALTLSNQADTVNGAADTGGIIIAGNGGNDLLTGGQGADSIEGGADNDTITGGAGDDTLRGGSGLDSLLGGDGADSINAGSGSDTAEGGAGDDTIDGSFGDDRLLGGDGNDTLLGGSGNDTILGGAGDDLIVAGSFGGIFPTSNDAGGNTNLLNGGEGNDTLLGSVGVDTLSGDAGDDSIDGQGGNDLIAGGEGRDTLLGGAGADTLTGGTGADVFIVDDGGDIITDFDTATGIQGGGAPDQSDNDLVDLSAFYNETTLAAWNAANPTNTFARPIDWLRADHADDGALAAVGGLQIRGADGNPVAAEALNFENTNVVCFADGTQIATAKGAVKVEALQPGDLIMTMDHGLQPLRWIGSRRLGAAELRDNPRLRPIRVAARAVGLPWVAADLVVSPQHRIMLASQIAERMCGASEVLVTAKDLLEMDGVTVAEDIVTVTYYHLLFDDHEIVFANGIPAESLYLGRQARKALSPEGLAEILAIFPDIATEQYAPVACRPILTGKRARKLGWRHLQNRKPLLDARLMPKATVAAQGALRH